MSITNTLQQRWCIINQSGPEFMAGLHKLETGILESTIRMGNPDIAIQYHPAVQEYVDRAYSDIQPFWDRSLMIMERLQRWDDFVKSMFKARLHEWEQADKEDTFSRDTKDNREAFARRQIKRLHDADNVARMVLRLDRRMEKAEQAGSRKSGWGGY